MQANFGFNLGMIFKSSGSVLRAQNPGPKLEELKEGSPFLKEKEVAFQTLLENEKAAGQPIKVIAVLETEKVADLSGLSMINLLSLLLSRFTRYCKVCQDFLNWLTNLYKKRFSLVYVFTRACFLESV